MTANKCNHYSYLGISGGYNHLPPFCHKTVAICADCASIVSNRLLRKNATLCGTKWLTMCGTLYTAVWPREWAGDSHRSRKITGGQLCRRSRNFDRIMIRVIFTPLLSFLFFVVVHLPSLQTLFKSRKLFNLKKYIFLHFILFTLIMSTSLFVILKQLFIPYCSFTPNVWLAIYINRLQY